MFIESGSAPSLAPLNMMHFKPYDGLGVVSSIHSCGQPREKELHWKHVSNLAVEARLVESPCRLGRHQES